MCSLNLCSRFLYSYALCTLLSFLHIIYYLFKTLVSLSFFLANEFLSNLTSSLHHAWKIDIRLESENQSFSVSSWEVGKVRPRERLVWGGKHLSGMIPSTTLHGWPVEGDRQGQDALLCSLFTFAELVVVVVVERSASDSASLFSSSRASSSESGIRNTKCFMISVEASGSRFRG